MSKSKVLFSAFLFFLASSAHAVMLTVDEYIYEGADTNTSLLSGTVDMSLVGNTLTMILTNTTSGIASSTASHNLLTGIGFNLPNSVWIGGGSAQMAATSNAINWNAAVLGSDLSGEWGYDNSPLNSGPFQTAPDGVAASSVNTTVSTMVSSTTSAFSGTPLLNPGSLAGPEFGLLSDSVDAAVAGGLYAVQSSMIFTLDLTDTLTLLDSSFDLISWIDSNDVVLSFGSPTLSSVPEPASLALFAIGLLLVVGFSRAKKPIAVSAIPA